MPYIPQFNKLSLSEMSYAPALMRQQHDDAIAKQMELSEAMKFDYLKQDAPGLEPLLQKYNTDIEDVSNEIARNGFSQDLKSKVLGLRQRYIGDDKIRHYKKQYSDAMSQWDETRKRMIQEGRPGDDINRQKEQFFSAYQGGYDPEGKFKNEFTAGRTSGYYDIGEDATKLMSNLGSTETPIVGGNASIERIVNPDGSSYYITKDFSRNGSITKNSDQVEAIKQYLKAEYGNEKTDRGLFAKISKFDPSYIDEVVDQIGTAKTSYKKEAPLLNTNYGGFGENKSQPSERPLPITQDLEVNKKLQKEADKDVEIMSTPKPNLDDVNAGITRINEIKKTIKDPRAAGYLEQGIQDATKSYNKRLKDWNDNRAKTISKYKSKYGGLFNEIDPVTGNALSEEDAVAKAIYYEKNNAATVSQQVHIVADPKSFGNKTMTEAIINDYVFPSKEKKISIDKDGDIKTKEDFSKLWDKESAWKESIPSVSRTGEIQLTGPKGEKYTLNDNALDVNTLKLKNEVLTPLLKQINDPQLGENDSFDPIEIPNMNKAIDVLTNPSNKYDIADRKIVVYDIIGRDEYGMPIPDINSAVKMTPSDAMQFITKGIFSGFKSVQF